MMARMRITRAAIPPITPPAIAPVLEVEDFAADALAVEVDDEEDVADEETWDEVVDVDKEDLVLVLTEDVEARIELVLLVAATLKEDITAAPQLSTVKERILSRPIVPQSPIATAVALIEQNTSVYMVNVHGRIRFPIEAERMFGVLIWLQMPSGVPS